MTLTWWRELIQNRRCRKVAILWTVSHWKGRERMGEERWRRTDCVVLDRKEGRWEFLRRTWLIWICSILRGVMKWAVLEVLQLTCVIAKALRGHPLIVALYQRQPDSSSISLTAFRDTGSRVYCNKFFIWESFKSFCYNNQRRFWVFYFYDYSVLQLWPFSFTFFYDTLYILCQSSFDKCNSRMLLQSTETSSDWLSLAVQVSLAPPFTVSPLIAMFSPAVTELLAATKPWTSTSAASAPAATFLRSPNLFLLLFWGWTRCCRLGRIWCRSAGARCCRLGRIWCRSTWARHGRLGRTWCRGTGASCSTWSWRWIHNLQAKILANLVDSSFCPLRFALSIINKQLVQLLCHRCKFIFSAWSGTLYIKPNTIWWFAKAASIGTVSWRLGRPISRA